MRINSKDNYRMIFVATPLSLLMVGVAFFIGIYMILEGNSGEYTPIVFLPIAFSLLCVITGKGFKVIRHSPVTLFLVGGYFIRMVLSPLLFCLGGYKSFFPSVVSSENVTVAVALLILEGFVVSFVILFKAQHVYEKKPTEINSGDFSTSRIDMASLFISVFVIIAYITIPAIQNIYPLLPRAIISEVANIIYDNETIVARGGIERYVYSLFMFLWPVVRTIIPAVFISHNYKKYGKDSRKGLVLSFTCFVIPAIILGSDNIAPFIGAIIIFFTIIRLYGKKSSKLLLTAMIIFAVFMITLVTTKMISYGAMSGSSGVANLAHLIQSYFPGFDNMAHGFSVNNSNKCSTLFYDLYYTIPFKETLFGLSGDNLSDVFNNSVAIKGQIIPWGWQLAHYLTIPGGCIVTALFASTAYKAERKSRVTNSFWKYYLNMYFSIIIAISISIYSFSIFLRTYVNTILPIVIIIAIGNRRRRKVYRG